MNKILDIFAAIRDVFYAYDHRRKDYINPAITSGLSGCVDRYVYELNKIFKANGYIYNVTINHKLQVSINKGSKIGVMIINFEEIEDNCIHNVELLEKILNERTT